jgi:transcriptional regulator with XRE-family HTH domain
MDKHQEYRDASGWWLAAWRDHAGLSLDDLAAEMETTKGQISDLERGTGEARYNRGWIEKASAALRVPAGYLLDVNPYRADPVLEKMLASYRALSDDDRATAAQMVGLLEERQKA